MTICSITKLRGNRLSTLFVQGAFAIALAASTFCVAEDGSQAWFLYAPEKATKYDWLPTQIFIAENNAFELAAAHDLASGYSSILKTTFTFTSSQYIAGQH